MAQTEFERELEIFRTDEEAAQQDFFCWLSFRHLLASDKEVHRAVNVMPLFWRTTHHAMLLSAFITLGRTFDQDSHHNLDRLVDIFARGCRRDARRFRMPLRQNVHGLLRLAYKKFAAKEPNEANRTSTKFAAESILEPVNEMLQTKKIKPVKIGTIENQLPKIINGAKTKRPRRARTGQSA